MCAVRRGRAWRDAALRLNLQQLVGQQNVTFCWGEKQTRMKTYLVQVNVYPKVGTWKYTLNGLLQTIEPLLSMVANWGQGLFWAVHNQNGWFDWWGPLLVHHLWHYCTSSDGKYIEFFLPIMDPMSSHSETVRNLDYHLLVLLSYLAHLLVTWTNCQ